MILKVIIPKKFIMKEEGLAFYRPAFSSISHHLYVLLDWGLFLPQKWIGIQGFKRLPLVRFYPNLS